MAQSEAHPLDDENRSIFSVVSLPPQLIMTFEESETPDDWYFTTKPLPTAAHTDTGASPPFAPSAALGMLAPSPLPQPSGYDSQGSFVFNTAAQDACRAAPMLPNSTYTPDSPAMPTPAACPQVLGYKPSKGHEIARDQTAHLSPYEPLPPLPTMSPPTPPPKDDDNDDDYPTTNTSTAVGTPTAAGDLAAKPLPQPPSTASSGRASLTLRTPTKLHPVVLRSPSITFVEPLTPSRSPTVSPGISRAGSMTRLTLAQKDRLWEMKRAYEVREGRCRGEKAAWARRRCGPKDTTSNGVCLYVAVGVAASVVIVAAIVGLIVWLTLMRGQS